MIFEIGDEVQFDGNDWQVVRGIATSVKGREPYRVYGVRGTGMSSSASRNSRASASVNQR